MELKKFNALNVSSKFAICGLPIRVDTYKTCTFGCKYCFANSRKIMEFQKVLQVGDMKKVERYLDKIFNQKKVDYTNFLDVLVSEGITWHCGGMSDPFQPCEKDLGITRQLIDITKKYGIDYAKEQIDDELFYSNCRDCKCNHLFTSNRQEGCESVQDFYDKRFYRKSSPFSPQFQYRENETESKKQISIFELK